MKLYCTTKSFSARKFCFRKMFLKKIFHQNNVSLPSFLVVQQDFCECMKAFTLESFPEQLASFRECLPYKVNPNYRHPRPDVTLTKHVVSSLSIMRLSVRGSFSMPPALLYRRASWSDLLFVKCTLLYSNYVSECMGLIAHGTWLPVGIILGIPIVGGGGSLIGNLWHHAPFDFTFIACSSRLPRSCPHCHWLIE